MSSKKITIRDVAQKAGVSVGTASRAMNSAPGVMKKTSKLVHDAARDLGYRPNAAARALRSRSSHLIGCLFSDLENPLYMRLFNSLQDRWAEAGFVTLMTSSSGLLDRETRAIATFADRGLDAIVVAPKYEQDPEIIRLLEAFPGPICIIDRDIPVSADRLHFDHGGAMTQAVDHLVQLGHRRIMPVMSNATTRPGRMRFAAFDRAMAAAGLTVDRQIAPSSPISPVFAEVVEALSGPDRPTAMVVQGTQVLSSTLNALAHLGLRVPDDVSLIAVGDSRLTEDHVPPITALRLDRAELVDVIANRVLAQIKGEVEGVADKELYYTLMERGSCSALSV